MAEKFPTDAFDSVPRKAGRHRSRRTFIDGALDFGKLVLAASVLTTAGYFAVSAFNSTSIIKGSDLPGGTVNTAVFTGGTRAGGVGITVLDGTLGKGFASALGHKLLDAGWNVFSAADLVLPSDHSSDQIKTTTIYVQTEALKTKVDSLTKDIGVWPVEVSTLYSDPITVVLGTDFK